MSARTDLKKKKEETREAAKRAAARANRQNTQPVKKPAVKTAGQKAAQTVGQKTKYYSQKKTPSPVKKAAQTAAKTTAAKVTATPRGKQAAQALPTKEQRNYRQQKYRQTIAAQDRMKLPYSGMIQDISKFDTGKGLNNRTPLEAAARSLYAGQNPGSRYGPLTERYSTLSPREQMQADTLAGSSAWASRIGPKPAERTDKQKLQDAVDMLKQRQWNRKARQQPVSQWDRKYLTPAQIEQKQFASQRYDDARAAGDEAGMANAHRDAEMLRGIHGYSGGVAGDEYITPDVPQEVRNRLNDEGVTAWKRAAMQRQKAVTEDEIAAADRRQNEVLSARGYQIMDPRTMDANLRQLRGVDTTKEERERGTAGFKAAAQGAAGSLLKRAELEARVQQDRYYEQNIDKWLRDADDYYSALGALERYDEYVKIYGRPPEGVNRNVLEMRLNNAIQARAQLSKIEHDEDSIFYDETHANVMKAMMRDRYSLPGRDGLESPVSMMLNDTPQGNGETLGEKLLRRAAEDYATATEGLNGFDRFMAESLIGTGKSLPAMALSAIPGVGPFLTLAVLAAQASGQKAYDLMQNGMDAETARWRGDITGVIEAAFERIPVGHWTKMLEGNAGKNALKNILIQAGEEGTEGGASYTVDTLLDWLAFQDPDAKFSLSELLENIGMEAVGGGIYGSVGSVVNSVRGGEQAQPVNRTDQMERVKAVASQIIDYHNLIDNGTMDRADGLAAISQLAEEITGAPAAITREQAGRIRDMADLETLAEQGVMLRQEARDAQAQLVDEAAKEQVPAQAAPQAERTPGYARYMYAKAMTAMADYQEDRLANLAAQEEPAPRSVSPVEQAVEKANEALEQAAQAQRRAEQNAQATLMAGSTTETARAYLRAEEDPVSGMGATLGTQGRALIQTAAPEGGGMTERMHYAGDFVRVYEAAFNGKGNISAGILDAAQYRTAVQAGQADRAESLETGIVRAKTQKTAGQPAFVYDGYAQGRVSKEDARLLGAMAQVGGVSIRFASQGEIGNARARGAIRGSDILLSKTMIRNGSDAVAFVAGHEMTHRLQDVAPEAYRALRDHVMGLEEYAAKVDDTMRLYAKAGQKLKREGAMDEIVADFAGQLVADHEHVRQFIQRYNGDRSLLQKVLDVLKEFAARLTGKYKAEADEGVRLLEEALKASEAQMKRMERSQRDNANDLSAQRQEDMQATAGLATTAAEAEQSGRYSLVTDRETLDFLNNQDTVTVFRAMQVIDGKLYPPMAAKVAEEAGKGKKRQIVEPTKLNTWYQSDERPDLATDDGFFVLDKGNGKTIKARYNPYFHTSATPLNDQFSSAYARPNLVTVEAEIPVSELTSEYKAEKAKDPVGETKWHAGPVASKLKGEKARRVYLSRWAKVKRIVPDAEVAGIVADTLRGEDIAVPTNVVTPSLLRELRKAGVKIEEVEGKGGARFSISAEDGFSVYYGIASYTDERIDVILKEYGGGGNYAQGFVTNIDPRDFLKLTISDRTLAKWVNGLDKGEFPEEFFPLDREKLRNNRQTPYLRVNTATGEVEGHEGRHRMLALAREGVTTAPVVLVDTATKYSKEPTAQMRLTSQDFGDGPVNGGYSVTVEDLIPTNKQYRDQIKETYGWEKAGVRFSLAGQAESPEFKKWFGDWQNDPAHASKVVNEDGTPKEMYHLSNAGDIHVFQSGNSAGLIYFADSIRSARKGARGRKHTYTAYLSATNPVNTRETPIAWYDAEDSVKVAQWKRDGYDGVWVLDETGVSFAVFSPEQIKSATDNVGTFDRENPDIRYSISAQADADYMAAVKRRDMEAAQKMVDEAAKKAGYSVKAYHGTPNGTFTVFRDWTYFTESKDYADIYQNQGASSNGYKQTADNPKTYGVYLNPGNAFDTRKARDRKIFERKFYRKWGNGAPLSERGLPDWTDGDDLIEFFEENGYDYDSFYLDEGGTGGYGDEVHDRGVAIIVKDSSQAKSADPVTYDDAGNVIPLSERFNTEKEDIRYSLGPGLDEARLARENQMLREKAAYWKSQMQRSDRTKAEPKEVKKLARKLAKDYLSDMDAGEIAGQLQGIYDGMGKDWSYDQARDAADKLARAMIEQASEEDGFFYYNYEPMRKYFRETPLVVTPEIQRGITDYNEWRKALMGKLRIRHGGQTNIDQVFQELSERWPEFFDETVTMNSLDQLERIAEVANLLYDREEVNPFAEDINEPAGYLSAEIMEAFWDIPNIKKSFADRAEARLAREKARTEEAKAAGRERLQTERERGRARLSAEREKRKALVAAEREKRDAVLAKLRAQHKEKYTRAMEKMRKDRDAKLAAQKEKYLGKERAKSVAQKERELRAKIQRHVNRLSTKLTRPTDTQHIPEGLREPVRLALERINLSSKDEKPTKRTQAFAALLKVYQDMEKQGSDVVIAPDLIPDVADIVGFADTPIANLGLTDLQTIWRAVRAIETSITTYNKALGRAKFETISAPAFGMRDYLTGRKDRGDYRGPIRAMDQLLNLGMLTPEEYFSRLGDSGTEVFKMLREAQDEHITIMENAQKAVRQMVKGAKIKRLEKQLHSFDFDGQEVTLTTAQIMSLYELMKRQQAMEHIRKGGVRPESVKGLLKERTPSEPWALTQDQLSEIVSVLTEDQVKLADKLQQYMENVLAELGNRASMEVYGYRKFTEKHYFPIAVDNNETRSDVKNAAVAGTIAGWGSARPLNPEAGNALIVRSVFDVFADHTTEMANYAAWLAPMENLNRILNFRFKDEDGNLHGGVKTLLTKVYGKNGPKYWEKLQDDLNNGVHGTNDNPFQTFIGAYKGSAIGANIRVIAQQPTAILRALNTINPADFVAGVALTRPTKYNKIVKKYAPIAVWKSWGYFTADTGRQMRNVLFDDDSAVSRINEILMSGVGAADSLAWSHIWNALEVETRRKRKDLKPGTDEFYRAVAERFNDVIDRTQVVDGILQRSQIMRSPDALTKIATSFMAEPTKVVNMFISDVYDVRNAKGRARAEAMGRLARTSLALTISFVANAAAQSLVDALRDDDKDETYWEKFLQAYFGGEGETRGEKVKDAILNGNLGAAFNPANYIPFVKDLISMAQGYKVSRMDMDVFQKIFTEITNYRKAMDGESKMTRRNATIRLTSEIARLLGIPAANLKRDVMAGMWTYYNETGNYRMLYEMEAFLYDVSNSKNLGEFCKILLAAERAGDTGAYDAIRQDMIDNGMDEETIDKKLSGLRKKALEENDEIQTEIERKTDAYNTMLDNSENFKQLEEDDQEKAREFVGDYAKWTSYGDQWTLGQEDQATFDDFSRMESLGIDPPTYASFRAFSASVRNSKDENGKDIDGEHAQDKVIRYIRVIPDLTDEQRAELFRDKYPKSDKNNPWA